MKGRGSYVVILKPFFSEERSKGGLIVPPSQTDDFFEATILDPGVAGEEDWGIIAGERVLVRNHNGKIKVGKMKNKGDIYIVEYDDILCSVESEEEAATLLG